MFAKKLFTANKMFRHASDIEMIVRYLIDLVIMFSKNTMALIFVKENIKNHVLISVLFFWHGLPCGFIF